jgi:HPt (histidine-containing phosphotransfer) domain-containing protein
MRKKRQNFWNKSKTALNEQNFEGFRRAAHSIKSTSNSFGAIKLGELARELEFMGRDQNLSGAESKVEILELTCHEVIKVLEGLCHA